MPVDNEIYNRAGDIWWDEHQPLNAILTAIKQAVVELAGQGAEAGGGLSVFGAF